MRIQLLALICLMVTIMHGQKLEPENELLLHILENETMNYGELRLISPIDSAMFAYDIKELIGKDENTFRVQKHYYNDSITITVEEIRSIINSLKVNWDWGNDSLISMKYKFVERDSMMDYLAENPKNTIALISRPVFLRDGTIAVVYFLNLCCGHIYGDLNFSFYKREDGDWSRWIDIRSGAF